MRNLVRVRHGETDRQRRFTARVDRRHPGIVVATGFDAHALRRATAAAVRSALDHADVPYVIVPNAVGEAGPEAIGISRVDHERAWAALRRALAGQGWLAELGPRPLAADPMTTDRSVPIESVRIERCDSVRLYRRYVSPTGDELGRAELGVNVDVWTRIGSSLAPRPDGGRFAEGTHLAPRRTLAVAYLSPQRWDEATRTSEHRVTGRARPILRVGEPVDIVYTWVDGLDPRWQQRKAAVAGAEDAADLNAAAANDARWLSHDELRYSLRSVAMYASWVRRIFIVTDQQVPAWLDPTHPAIQVVDHREIFADPSVLPVFNSHAIESQVHHIPGLAEQYLYFNDDFFVGRPVEPELFFHANGIAKFFLSRAPLDLDPPTNRDLPVMSAAKQNRGLLERAFGVTVTQKFWHTPQPQLRSVLEQMEREQPGVFAQVAASRFRHPDDYSIPSALAHYYAFLLGKAVPGELRYRYQDVTTPATGRLLDGLLRRREFDVFCLNDGDGAPADHASRAALLKEFFERYYPVPAPWEKS